MKKTGIIATVVLFFIMSIGVPAAAGEYVFADGRDLLLTTNQLSLTAPSAESYLSTLAYEEERDRKIGGAITTGLGVLLLGAGLTYDDDNAEFEKDIRSIYYVSGGVLTIVGVCVLAVPGYAESEYERVMKIDDENRREQASYAAMVNVANRAKLARIYSGLFSGAMCIYYLTADHDYYSSLNNNYYTYNALFYGALCAYSFLMESSAEKMLHEYRANQDVLKDNGRLAITPRLD